MASKEKTDEEKQAQYEAKLETVRERLSQLASDLDVDLGDDPDTILHGATLEIAARFDLNGVRGGANA